MNKESIIEGVNKSPELQGLIDKLEKKGFLIGNDGMFSLVIWNMYTISHKRIKAE